MVKRKFAFVHSSSSRVSLDVVIVESLDRMRPIDATDYAYPIRRCEEVALCYELRAWMHYRIV